jgi:predicted enzyme related to lactoylglutathione lyase
MATVTLYADDVTEAANWYAELLGIQPYFVRPEQGPAAYIEFRVGDTQDELGILDRRYRTEKAQPGPGGAVLMWHVDDIDAALARLKELGATEYEPRVEREAGFVTAAVVDPFGNVLGVMYNPHYLEMLTAKGAGTAAD